MKYLLILILFISCTKADIGIPSAKGGKKGKPQTEVPPPALPTAYRISVPEVITQGGEGSCVPMAVVYYQLSAEYKTRLSPEYVYNQIKSGSCGSGSSIINCFYFLMNNGTVTWETLPYSSTNGCETTPTNEQKTEALNYRIKGYHTVYSAQPDSMKGYLAKGHPLSFTFTADYNWYYGAPEYIWNENGTTYGPHAGCVVGYDDSKRAWLTVNSFGTSFGDAGFRWIDYEFFKTITITTYKLNL